MHAPPITARFYIEGDEEQLLDLLTGAFGRWPKHELSVSPIEHLRWKLRSHPSSLSHQIIAEQDGRIVGARLGFVQRMKAGERILLARQSLDTCVLPELQQTGVLTELRRFGRKEILGDFDLNFFIESGHRALQKLRPRQLIPTEEFENLTDVLRCRVDEADLDDAEASTAWSVSEMAGFDERIDEFFEEASQAFRFMIVRDREYLNWRFAERAGNFRRLVAEQGGRVLGYAVVRTSFGRGHIADLLSLPARIDVVRSLARDALRLLQEAGVTKADCWVQRHHPYRAVLQECGFSEVKRTVTLAYQPHRIDSADLAFLRDPQLDMHATVSDTDLV